MLKAQTLKRYLGYLRGYFLVTSEKNVQVFVDLGLTVLQAKVYLSLVQTGKTKVKTISQTAKVSRPDVYRTLARLQDLGLVEKEIVNPVKFKSIPIETALEMLLESKKSKYIELKTKSEQLLKRLNVNQALENTRKSAEFVLVPSKQALIKKMQDATDNTVYSIDLVSSCKRLKYACYCLSDALKQAWNRNVTGRAIIENPAKNHTEIFEKCWTPWAKIHVVSKLPPTVMTLHDNHELFIFIDPSADLRDSPALWTTNPSVITLAEHYFEFMWIASTDFNSLKKRAQAVYA